MRISHRKRFKEQECVGRRRVEDAWSRKEPAFLLIIFFIHIFYHSYPVFGTVKFPKLWKRAAQSVVSTC